MVASLSSKFTIQLFLLLPRSLPPTTFRAGGLLKTPPTSGTAGHGGGRMNPDAPLQKKSGVPAFSL